MLGHAAATAVTADDDRIAILGEARDESDVTTAAAPHGDDGADLRSDVLVSFPRQGAVTIAVHICCFANTGGLRCPDLIQRHQALLGLVALCLRGCPNSLTFENEQN